jgi:hypothetical protein
MSPTVEHQIDNLTQEKEGNTVSSGKHTTENLTEAHNRSNQ